MGELHSSIVKLKDMISALESRMTSLEQETGVTSFDYFDDNVNHHDVKYDNSSLDPMQCPYTASARASTSTPHNDRDRKKPRRPSGDDYDATNAHESAPLRGGPTSNHARKKDRSVQPLQWALTYTGKGISIEANVLNLGDLGHMIDQFRSAVKDLQKDETVDSTKPEGDINADEERKRREACFESKEAPMNPKDSYVAPGPHRQVSVFPQVTDHLIYSFFNRSCCHLPLPLLDKRTFLERYHDPNNPAPPVLVFSVCAPSAIFACRIHYPPMANYNTDRAFDLANGYSYKAWELLENQFDCSDVTTIQSILYLLFFSNNCHGRPYSWGIQLTLAIRMAFELDLHCERTYATHVREWGPARTEEARRTFWAIFNHATWVSISMGTKSVMDDARITAELPYVQDDEVMDDNEVARGSRAYTPPELREGPLDEETRDIRLFFHQMSELMQIYEQMQVARLSKTAGEAVTQNLHTLLDGWFEALAPQFEDTSPVRLAAIAGTGKNHLLIAVVWLHVHYHLGLIWLHQHFLLPGATFDISPSAADPNTITPPTSPTNSVVEAYPNPASLSFSLSTCAHAAASITTLTDHLVARRADCQMSIHALFFGSNVYEKMLKLGLGDQWDQFARKGMLHNIEILKASRSYDDGRELYVSFAKLMEEKARRAVAAWEEERRNGGSNVVAVMREVKGLGIGVGAGAGVGVKEEQGSVMVVVVVVVMVLVVVDYEG
ncbi:fungal-specific transcription factor domain-containing protein [Jimgerdemannia flammicorona]|uniref:Fungal-specific transcription factor domain-containing protein n=1 Tax=Jimgerdemannia flammicorona TaxID=994334 RepID=A0A433Q0Y2_9FUNG|nr:fungal-specific transcription factor domain-containing protein [Jimgerdemannia flammicorona]